MEEYGRVWYNIGRYYTSADLQSDQREDYFHGKSCASPGEHMKKLDCDFAVLADYK